MANNEAKKTRLLKKQLGKVEKKESKLLEKKESKFLKEKVAPLTEKLESKIPPKLQATLEKAFEKGFRVVFERGVDLIERTYQKDERLEDFDVKHYALVHQTNRKNMKKLDQNASKSIWGNQVLSTVEGSVLGALGIGLPDIPILIGMILKSIYEVSLSYGVDYEVDKEKVYILYLICVGVTKESQQAVYNEKLEQVAREIREGWCVEASHHTLDTAMEEAATCLAEAMLFAKFIQGIPLVGVVGGISNYSILNNITRIARVKYKKRYLESIL